MSNSDVTKLRKEGKLREAYDLAKAQLEAAPDDIWAKRAMAWVLYDYTKKYTNIEKKSEFLRCLQQITLLQMPEDEELFLNNAGLLVRNVVRKCVGMQNVSDFLTSLWHEIRQWNIPIPSKIHSETLRTFVKVKDSWTNFGDFCDWWNFDNLLQEDFNPVQFDNGNSDLPLAEKAFNAYSKFLLKTNNVKKIELWLPKLEFYSKIYPKFTFLPYYSAKLSLISQNNTESLKEKLKPLVRKKSGEFWIWELLGDIATSEEEKLAMYSKAMLCKTSEKMTVSLREKVAGLLLQWGFRAEALFEFKKIVEIRNKNKWKIEPQIFRSIEDLQKENLTVVENNTKFYQKYVIQAETLIFGQMLTERVTVTHINTEKNFISFKTKDNKSGFFRENNPKRLNSVTKNSIIEIKTTEISTKKPTKVQSWKIVPPEDGKTQA